MCNAEAINRIATSDLVRWYSYRFVILTERIIEITKPGGQRFWVDYDGSTYSVQTLMSDYPDDLAKAQWIESVLNGKSLSEAF